MSYIREVATVTRMNLRNIPKRMGTSLTIVVGIAGVVAVLVSVLAMATGFVETINNTGRDDRAIVLRGGATSELTSALSHASVDTILNAPGIRRDASDHPNATADAVVIADLQQKDGSPANVTLRGVSPGWGQVRPEIHVIAGRMFAPGTREIIVGSAAQSQFAGLAIGSSVSFRDSQWTVVGTFASGGNAFESQIITDAPTLLGAYRRGFYESVTVFLQDEDSFDKFKGALTSNPALSVDVIREKDYYAGLSERLGQVLTVVGYSVGSVMALGAIFGALNTMHSAVATRNVEIATLRAIGFGTGGVIVSVMAEAVLLALVGGMMGAGLSWLFFNGNAVSTLSGNYSQIVFKLVVTPGLLLLGICWAMLIGVVGGIFPATAAGRLVVAKALRAQ